MTEFSFKLFKIFGEIAKNVRVTSKNIRFWGT